MSAEGTWCDGAWNGWRWRAPDHQSSSSSTTPQAESKWHHWERYSPWSDQDCHNGIRPLTSPTLIHRSMVKDGAFDSCAGIQDLETPNGRIVDDFVYDSERQPGEERRWIGRDSCFENLSLLRTVRPELTSSSRDFPVQNVVKECPAKVKVVHWEETEEQVTEERHPFPVTTFLSHGRERCATTSEVIDTACARTLAGTRWFKKFEVELKKQRRRWKWCPTMKHFELDLEQSRGVLEPSISLVALGQTVFVIREQAFWTKRSPCWSVWEC